MAIVPAEGNTDNAKPDFVDQLLAIKESQRRRELLDVSHDYMRNAHLLPPYQEFDTVDRYVYVLKRFEQAIRHADGFYQFNPTTAQLWLNGKRLLEWEASQRRPRGRPNDDDRRKRALGLLNWRIYTGRNIGKHYAPALWNVSEGERDVQARDAMRYLAPLVNDGSLTRDELHNAIIDACGHNKHIPENKSRSFVERQIDDAIAKYTEAFPWERLADDVR
jgi:hypothetical protein